MATQQSQNIRVFLRSRPGESNPVSVENFAIENIPILECKDGEIIAKTLCLSVDPYMRCRFNENSGVDYMKSWQIGETIDASGTGVILESKDESFKPGDVIHLPMCWPFQKFVNFNSQKLLSNADSTDGLHALQKVESDILQKHPSLTLGLLGVTGMTAILGLREKAHIVPGANQTVVISGAAGACGSAAGQIAKLEGCGKVVGICGTDEKCQHLVNDLGFDASINYRTIKNIQEKLSECCPEGVDVYFDNVGGEISNEVIKSMNKDSHVVLCGQISQYDKDLPYPPPIPDNITEILKKNNITRERYTVLNYPEKFHESLVQLETWLKEGRLKNRETFEMGLENAGNAFVSMMSGKNIGKQIIQVDV
ncbi:prostaglandin reductase 2-like [Dendronephthya gigantea]|uniref:prostaglandin reductase 2-like n=1 Tax=Dendronephthya gigantea TaxID=151771 RepID=UPI00106D46A5|nr:prostaglandin reductase 2-like [Dendronephthya gigantea]